MAASSVRMAQILCRSISGRLGGGGSSFLGRVGSALTREGSRRVPRPEQCIQVATLIPTYGGKFPYEEPFDYQNKTFGSWQQVTDKGSDRFNENTKVIIVEGNIGVGKNEFAKELASHFDLKYFPSVPEEQCYRVPHNGFDIRELDELLPAHLNHYDLQKFYKDPNPECGRIGTQQIKWYQQKFFTYCEAILHLMSTGQGVVITRSVFSDRAFVDAMRKCGYITGRFSRYYNELERSTQCELPHPHITVYLDAPLSVLKQRIQQRNDAKEQNSAVLSDKYIESIDRAYRNLVLPELRETGEVIEIDWTEKADKIEMDVIVEELAQLSLKNDDKDDPKFLDWEIEEDDVVSYRRRFSKKKGEYYPGTMAKLFMVDPPMDCPEIILSGEDYAVYDEVVNDHPGVRLEPGYAPELGYNPWVKVW